MTNSIVSPPPPPPPPSPFVQIQGSHLPEALRFAAKQLSEVSFKGKKLQRVDVYRIASAGSSLLSLLQRARSVPQSDSMAGALWRCVNVCQRQATAMARIMQVARDAEAAELEEAKATAAAAPATAGEETDGAGDGTGAVDATASVTKGRVLPVAGDDSAAGSATTSGAGAGAGAGAGTTTATTESGAVDDDSDAPPTIEELEATTAAHEAWRSRELSSFHSVVRYV